MILATPVHWSFALALLAFAVSMYALQTAMRYDLGLERKLSLVVHVVTFVLGWCFIVEGIVCFALS